MGALKNVFSWSFSAAHDFEECPRRRYWSKYGAWGGWSADATDLQRVAWRLNKMTNLYALQGVATEEAAMWLLSEVRAGRAVTSEQAYEAVARPFLNRCWKESRSGAWQHDPKRCCCLREHYYGQWDRERERERTRALAQHTRTCLRFFADRVLPRLHAVRPEQELPIAVPGAGGGDAEHFDYEGVKVYAIPDYAYREGTAVHIHDWKAGRVKPSHRRQLAVYALWAMARHAAEPSDVFGYVEYLATGQVAPVVFDDELMAETRDYLESSVSDMTAYLVGGDRLRNEPVPREEWDLAPDPQTCGWCSFYELCRPELEG